MSFLWNFDWIQLLIDFIKLMFPCWCQLADSLIYDITDVTVHLGYRCTPLVIVHLRCQCKTQMSLYSLDVIVTPLCHCSPQMSRYIPPYVTVHPHMSLYNPYVSVHPRCHYTSENLCWPPKSVYRIFKFVLMLINHSLVSLNKKDSKSKDMSCCTAWHHTWQEHNVTFQMTPVTLMN